MTNTPDDTWKERITEQLRAKHQGISEANLQKLVALEQRKAKAERQARLILKGERDKERKARTRKLIEIGGLIAKAGLDKLDKETVLGLLMDAKAKSADAEQVKAWKAQGVKAFSEDQK